MAEVSEALTIMIVDDDELIRKVVTIYFGNRGHHVVNAMNGQDCLDKMQASEPDAVLLDVTMPGMDGWEVCRRIRVTSDVPIIILTARAQERRSEDGGRSRRQRVCDQAGVAEGVGSPSSVSGDAARFFERCRRLPHGSLIQSKRVASRANWRWVIVSVGDGADITGPARLESPAAFPQHRPCPRR